MNAMPTPDTARGRPPVEYPESDGKPMGESDLHIDELIDLRLMLRRHLEGVPEAYVGSDMFVYYEEGDPQRVFCPDVFVAFGVGKHRRRTFKLWEERHAPSVVIEISSRSTWLEDAGNKMAVCARLGVAEYYIYDPEGEYLEPALQGFRLRGGHYVPMKPDAHGRLRSTVLGLVLGLGGDGLIVLSEVETGRDLPRPDEALRREAAARAAAEARAAAAEAELERLRSDPRRRGGQ